MKIAQPLFPENAKNAQNTYAPKGARNGPYRSHTLSVHQVRHSVRCRVKNDRCSSSIRNWTPMDCITGMLLYQHTFAVIKHIAVNNNFVPQQDSARSHGPSSSIHDYMHERIMHTTQQL